MIPTAVKGYMPFVPTGATSATSTTSHRRNQSPVPTRVKSSTPPQVVLKKQSPRQSPPKMGHFVPATIRTRCSSYGFSGDNLPTRSKQSKSLSGVDKDEVLHKDRSWRALLKAIFKSKGKKTKVSDSDFLSVGFNNSVRGTNLNRRDRRFSLPAMPIQRSHSLSMPRKNIIKLESILEEDFDPCEYLVGIGTSAPNACCLDRPSSDLLNRKANHIDLSQSSSVWSDTDSSCESIPGAEPDVLLDLTLG